MPAGTPLLALIHRLSRDAGARWLQRHARGTRIFEEGDAAQAAWLLVRGLVKIIRFSPRSDPATMEIVGPGGLFGAVAVMDRKPYPVSAEVLQDAEAYRIPAAEFLALLERDAAFARDVYRQMGEHLRHAQQLRALSREPVEKRFASLLLLLSASLGPDLRLRREDLAQMVGSTPETAIRVLGGFRKKKWIGTGWKRIHILDAGALASRAEGDS